MKKSKITIIIILFIIITAIILFIAFSQSDKKRTDEYQNYIPEEEISESQARQTIITLYFVNKETGEVAPEARLVDAVTLIDNPYKELVKLLINGPKNEKLNGVISSNVKINSTTLKDRCVIIDFSQEFLTAVENNENKYNVINSIVNTLTELNEVDSVRFLIDGNENENINEVYVRVK